MVEGARLESVCTVILYREFESLTLRHFFYLKTGSFDDFVDAGWFSLYIGLQHLGLAQGSLMNLVRSGRKQR